MNVPFICVGICQNGTNVDCQKPTIDTQSKYKNWANCGNGDCMKLVDPRYEIEMAKDSADWNTALGYFLIGLGGAVAIFSTIAYLKCCYDPKDDKDGNDEDNGDKE